MKLIINMRKRSTRKHDNCSDLVNFHFSYFISFTFRFKRSPGIFNFYRQHLKSWRANKNVIFLFLWETLIFHEDEPSPIDLFIVELYRIMNQARVTLSFSSLCKITSWLPFISVETVYFVCFDFNTDKNSWILNCFRLSTPSPLNVLQNCREVYKGCYYPIRHIKTPVITTTDALAMKKLNSLNFNFLFTHMT